MTRAAPAGTRRRRCRRRTCTSRSLTSLRNGKLFAPCIENVNTDGSSRKIAAVPLPWCTSQSTTAMRRDGAVALQHARGDRDVVEDAVALAAIGETRDACRRRGSARQLPSRTARASAPRRASRPPIAATARPSSATTGSRCAAARRRTACPRPRRRRIRRRGPAAGRPTGSRRLGTQSRSAAQDALRDDRARAAAWYFAIGNSMAPRATAGRSVSE